MIAFMSDPANNVWVFLTVFMVTYWLLEGDDHDPI
ncbi:hypothetical protein Q19_11 [Pectobacterium phage Q19]|uniref:Uncharacterized protein n=1 Tax=Pectobacterium phage Q19 TaxID=2500576 RepID=A0A678ZKD3_9CAUD|nr:hypothetical protein Q19_11 [Pectobacterium phage Q19]